MIKNKGKIAVIEDDAIIAWDFMDRLGAMSECDIVSFDSYADFDISCVIMYEIVFCNLRLIEGWLPQLVLDSVIDRTDRFVLFTGLSDLSNHGISIPSDIQLLLKPYTSHQLKQVLGL